MIHWQDLHVQGSADTSGLTSSTRVLQDDCSMYPSAAGAADERSMQWDNTRTFQSIPKRQI